jgi:hypothetical protein
MKESTSDFGRAIHQQVKKRKFVRVFLSLALIIFLPLFIIIVNKSQDIRQHASATQQVTFIDTANNPITQTTQPMVHVALASPWGVSQVTAMSADNHAVLGQQTASFQVSESYGDVNEVNNVFDGSPTNKTLWIGNSSTTTTSYTGLRFTHVTIPKNAVISSAIVQVLSTQNSWITMKFSMMGDASGNSQPFSTTSLPSSRIGTVAKINHASNTKWQTNTWYSLNDIQSVIQEIVNRPDWQSGNSISIILKGTGQTYGRKFVSSFDGGAITKLLVSFDAGITVPPTASPTFVLPTSIPTNIPAPSTSPTATTVQVQPTATPVPTTKDITLSEDSNFTTNVVTIGSVTTNPLYTMYTFSNTTPGLKTLYVKFRSTTGQEQVYSNTITLVSTTTPTPISQNGDNSYAMGLWNPNITYDTCSTYPTSADTNANGVIEDSEKIAYIKSIHDSYKVKGPDGKWYPTWHPAIDPTTGCKFGHEHGRDPKGSEMWKTKQIQTFFFYDANKNLVMDPSEEAVTGLPFGYVNQQMDTYYAALGKSTMRHEDHMGHKVEYANGEGDIATDQADTSLTGGVHVQRNKPIADTGVRCYYLAKPHQGVSSPDAFTNNIHEVFYFADCRYPNNPTLNQKISIAEMEGFGKPGGFTSFMPLCGIERRSDPQDFINLGTDAMNSQYPTGNGDREIITRDCIEKGFLVPQGSYSGNLYEAWPASLSIKAATGKTLVSGINLLFDVEDANRYFYPDALKAQRGYVNPDAKPNTGFTMDLCYDTSLQAQGRIARGGLCEYATNYGQIKGIKWNDPRSAFRGLHRGMYFMPATLDNAGGPEYWYTDPFGENASQTPFAGSIRQQLTPANINYGTTFGVPIDPRVNDREHSDGNGTVHAPN